MSRLARILLAEDSPTQAQRLAAILEEAGFRVEIAADGDRALDKLRSGRFDLVLSDVLMPGLSGYELCRTVKRGADPVPVVLLTSLTEAGDVLRGLESGADNYLLKPCDADELVRRVRATLARAARARPRAAGERWRFELDGEGFEIGAGEERILDYLASAYRDLLRFRAAELERTERENRLKGSVEFLQSVLDALEAEIAVLDETGRIVAVNRAWRRFGDEAGLDLPDHGVGASYLDACARARGEDEAVGRRVLKALEEILRGARARFSLEYPSLDRWFALHASGIETAQGRLAIVAHVDITERKTAELALSESERRHRALLEALPDLVLFLDADGVVQQVKPAPGIPPSGPIEEVIGRRVHELLPKEIADEVERRRRIVDETRETSLFEYSLPAEGGLQWLEARFFWVGKGEVLVVVRDITERKRAEATLRATEEQLQRSQKMEAIGRLAGGVAHDFNNVLTAVMGYSDLALLALEPESPIRRDIEEIKKAADRAAALTRQLLAFGRRQVLQPRVVDLNDIVRDLKKMLHRVIAENIELVLALDPSLGAVKADPGQIEQVVVNLAVNASDAMPAGGRLVIETANAELDEVYAEQHRPMGPGRYAMLAVSDEGHGMSADVRARIFEPFFTTKEKGKGTGLGLSTVYGIVKQSGGYIWVYSEPGEGTTFKIYFPLVEGRVEHDRPVSAAATDDRGSETILLVEDDARVRSSIARILADRGYRVLEAGNGSEGLRLYRAHAGRVDLVVTDVVMPEKGGPAFVRELDEAPSETKVLYISGYTDESLALREVPARAHFLAKPFTAKMLTRKVREILDGGGGPGSPSARGSAGEGARP